MRLSRLGSVGRESGPSWSTEQNLDSVENLRVLHSPPFQMTFLCRLFILTRTSQRSVTGHSASVLAEGMNFSLTIFVNAWVLLGFSYIYIFLLHAFVSSAMERFITRSGRDGPIAYPTYLQSFLQVRSVWWCEMNTEALQIYIKKDLILQLPFSWLFIQQWTTCWHCLHNAPVQFVG